MRWSRTPKLMSLALAAALAACSDAATAPHQQLTAAPPMPSWLITVEYMAADSMAADFTVDSGGGVFQLGPHAISFPSHGICDPATSTYGVGTWDEPCTPLEQPISIHAEIRRANGKEWVDFTPSLRFVPTSMGSEGVYLWLKVDSTYAPTASDPLNILWMPAPGLPGIDEASSDPDLATQYSAENQVVFRRIKHFSGYMVAAD